jgi:hypothetical protein
MLGHRVCPETKKEKNDKSLGARVLPMRLAFRVRDLLLTDWDVSLGIHLLDPYFFKVCHPRIRLKKELSFADSHLPESKEHS